MGMVIHNKSNKKSDAEILYDNVTRQSQSTQIEDIEDDLENTELQEIDKELQQIEQELEQAY
jgi:hypothetical protein